MEGSSKLRVKMKYNKTIRKAIRFFFGMVILSVHDQIAIGKAIFSRCLPLVWQMVGEDTYLPRNNMIWEAMKNGLRQIK